MGQRAERLPKSQFRSVRNLASCDRGVIMDRKFRALIVDDERPARQRLRDLLEKQTTVEIMGECSDGLTAVRALKENLPDLLFLDVQMPRLNGFDVLRKVGPNR